MDTHKPILIVDDDAAVCWALEQALLQGGFTVCVAASAVAAKRQIRRHDPALVITDVRMPGGSGIDLLDDVRREWPQLPVIVTTAYGTIDTAVAAVARGAFGYLPKPLDLARTLDLVKQAAGQVSVAFHADPDAELATDSDLVGVSPAIQEVFRRIAAAATSDFGVLITGATGTGKELVARAIHRHSKRRDGPFVAVNCSAIPEQLVESELFGHVAGSFTGAVAEAPGYCRAAAGGTLFLDEVGDLPAMVQSKLLRFLEDHRARPVGATHEIELDLRVIAATNIDLQPASEEGMRSDLVYRLRAFSIHMPALAERSEDVPMLVERLLGRIARQLRRPLSLTTAAFASLQRQEWPGNVRELKHRLEQAAVFAPGGIIDASALERDGERSLDADIRAIAAVIANDLLDRHPGDVHRRYIDRLHGPFLASILSRTDGNYAEASRLLGINRITLRRWMDGNPDGESQGPDPSG